MAASASDITLVVEIAVDEGKAEAFRRVVADLVSTVQDNEPGCLRYDFYLSSDGRHDWNVEVFCDSEAVIAHMENVRDLLPLLLDTASFQRIEVLGGLSDAGYAALSEISRGDHRLIGRIERGLGARDRPLTEGQR
jgi:quinol monooxygenase YgiN